MTETIENMAKKYPDLAPKDLLEKKVIPKLESVIDEAELVGKKLDNYLRDLGFK